MKGSTEMRSAVRADLDSPEPEAVPAFSNASEFDVWSDRWCATCVRDGDVDAGEGCPLLLVAFCGETPPEWRPTGMGDYVCVAWTDDPSRAPCTERARPVDGQTELFAEPEHSPPKAGLVGRAWEAGVRPRRTPRNIDTGGKT